MSPDCDYCEWTAANPGRLIIHNRAFHLCDDQTKQHRTNCDHCKFTWYNWKHKKEHEGRCPMPNGRERPGWRWIQALGRAMRIGHFPDSALPAGSDIGPRLAAAPSALTPTVDPTSAASPLGYRWTVPPTPFRVAKGKRNLPQQTGNGWREPISRDAQQNESSSGPVDDSMATQEQINALVHDLWPSACSLSKRNEISLTRRQALCYPDLA